MTVVLWIAMAMLAAAILLGLARVVTASDGATQAVVGDLVFFAGVGMILLIGMKRGTPAVLDAAMLAALLGVLATVALARILTRGHR